MGLLRWLFARKNDDGKVRSRRDSHAGLLAGYRFHANLVPRTPLWILEQHGALYESPTFEVHPDDGVWVPELASSHDFLMAADGSCTGTMESIVGEIPVDGGDFLRFLKAFRAIVESGDDVEDQITRLRALYDSDPAFDRFRPHLGDDIARKWFCAQLTSLPGISARAAEHLFDAGYRTPDAVQAASDSDLLAVTGVGKATIARIRGGAG